MVCKLSHQVFWTLHEYFRWLRSILIRSHRPPITTDFLFVWLFSCNWRHLTKIRVVGKVSCGYKPLRIPLYYISVASQPLKNIIFSASRLLIYLQAYSIRTTQAHLLVYLTSELYDTSCLINIAYLANNSR